jgi:hypothetical protein
MAGGVDATVSVRRTGGGREGTGGGVEGTDGGPRVEVAETTGGGELIELIPCVVRGREVPVAEAAEAEEVVRRALSENWR